MHACCCVNAPIRLQHTLESLAAQREYACFPSASIHLQGAMQALRTPCIQAFLHLLPAGGLLWAFMDVVPLTVGLAKGIAPTAVSNALQARSMLMASVRCCQLLAVIVSGLKGVTCPSCMITLHCWRHAVPLCR